MIITREKGMRMWGGGSGSTSASGVNGGGGFSLAVEEGEGTGNAYTDFTYESGTLTLNKATEFVTVDFFNKLFTAYDANGNVIAPNNTTPTLDNIKFKAGAWTEQYLSALGQNSSGGGGGGGIELSDVWQSLKTNTDDYANQKINSAHIPDLSGTYATKTWVNQQGFVTSSGVTSVAMTVPTGLSVSGSPITTTGTLALTFANGYSIPTTAKQGNWDTAYGWGNHASAGYALASDVYSSSASRTKNYVLAAPSTANGAATFRKLVASDIPDLSSTYATASRATTLEGYFNSGGVAKEAAKLSTVSKKAWGQTYWTSGGVPQDVDGTLTISGGELMMWNTADTSAENRWDMRFMCLGDVFQMWAYEGAYHDLAIGNTAAATATYKGLYYDASEKRWGIGTTTPAYAFDVQGNIGATGAITLAGTSASTRRIYFGDTSHYIELTSTGFHFSHGIYSDSFVSALGANSSGGGSGTFDEEAMWTALGTTITAKVIASSHIPNLDASKITSGTFAAARIPDLSGNYYALYGGTDLNPTSSNTINLNDVRSTGSYYVSTNTPSQYVTNKPDDTQNYAFRVWVSAPGGISGYRRQRFQYLTQMTIYERFYSSDTSSWGDWYKVQDNLGNYATTSSLNSYLPLSGGTITGSLTVNSSINVDEINAKNGSGLLVYKPASGWGGVSSTQWSVGSADCEGVIRSSNTSLLHYNAGMQTSYVILDSSNYNIYSPTLTGTGASGTWGISVSGSAAQANQVYDYQSGNGAYFASCQRGLGGTNTGALVLAYGSNPIRFYTNGTEKMRIAAAGSVGIGTDSPSYKLHVQGTVGMTTEGQGTIRFIAADSTNYIQSGNAAFNGNADMIIGGYSATTGTNLNLAFNVVNATNILKVKTYLTLGYGAEGIYLNGTGIYWHNASDSWTKNIMSFTSTGATTINGVTTISSTTQVSGVDDILSAGSDVAGTSAANKGFAIRLGMYNGNYSTKIACVYEQSNPQYLNPAIVFYTMYNTYAKGSEVERMRLSSAGNLTVSGEVTASSDERKKNIISNTKFNVKDIASARSVLFEWKDRKDKIHGGSIAQDWLGIADSFLMQDDDGFYSINYGALALCSAITIAREVLKHSDEIDRLKQEVSYLKARVAELEERRIA